jgi:hypothetical protein
MKKSLRSKGGAVALATVLFLAAFNLFGFNTPTASATDFSVTNQKLAAGLPSIKDVLSPQEIPGGVGVTAKVTIHRDGSDNDFARKKIEIELFKPGNAQPCETTGGGAADVEVGQTPQTFTLQCGPAEACGNWKVRVTNRDSGNAKDATATFSVVFTADLSPRNLDIEGGKINLDKGNSVRKQIRNIKGSGVVRLKGKWETDLLDILHAGAKKLTVRLLKNGQQVATQTAFSQSAKPLPGQSAASLNPKLDFSFTITKASFHASDRWEVEIVNDGEAHLVDIDIFGTFTPGCN